MTRVSSAVLILLLLPASVFASLGGSVSTVEADRVRTQSALLRIARTGPYTIHEILTPTGTTVREFYGSDGVVFGVAWNGEWQPDLRQIFGDYFAQYQTAVDTARKKYKVRRRVAVDDGSLVVRIGGHLHSVTGVAYVPRLLPAGVDPGVIN